MVNVWKKVSEFGLVAGMPLQEQKKIFLLNRLSFSLIVFFSFGAIVAYKQLYSPVLGYFFTFNVIVISATFLSTKFLNRTVSKFILSVFLPVSIIVTSIYAKSIGVTNNLIQYLLPRMVLAIIILIPVFLFGYRDIKRTVLAIIPGIIVFVFYDKINLEYGIGIRNLSFELEHYKIFVGVIVLLLIFIITGILSLQSANFENELKLQNTNNELITSEEELKEQNDEILAINVNLKQQQEIISVQKEEMQKLLTAVEQSDSGIIITDKKGVIEYANPAFVRLTGYKKEEVIGKKPNILNSGHHTKDFYEDFWNTINSGKVWKGTFKNKKKNGELYWEQETISPIKNNHGEIINFVAVREDISKRKEDEEILDEAYKTIHEKNTSIRHSLNYAKRIQMAMLPSDRILKNNFADHFIINKGRDIVSGDFYYFSETDKEVIVAVADCTGHGVPGGFMTMLGHAFLDDIINRKDIPSTGEILNELRRMIIKSLNQNDFSTSSKDGMDISICRIEKETLKMQYSGAYNPILIIKNGKSELIKADRMPIGDYPKMKPFETRNLTLEKNDLIYLFSDGFQDQFGGVDKQRYQSRNFYNLLTTNQNEPLNKQKELIETELQNWIGEENQIDDILILGVKI